MPADAELETKAAPHDVSGEARDEGGKWTSGGGGGGSGEDFRVAKLPPSSDDREAKAPNPDLHDHARPHLEGRELAAVRDYSGQLYEDVNAYLRTGKGAGDEFIEGAHAALQSAFAKARDLPEPVTVRRGMDVRRIPPAERKEFLASLAAAAESGGEVRLSGYTSTSTRPDAALDGDTRVEIVARRGLDLKPYSDSPQEWEFLLDHDSRFRVLGLDDSGGKRVIRLEQLT